MLFKAAELTPRRAPLNDPNFIYELKHDGFRALAHTSRAGCTLVSRKGNAYKSFADLGLRLRAIQREAVIDGELVVLDPGGRSQFYELMRRRGAPVFYAFDCLSIDGDDLRTRPLIERKNFLRELVAGVDAILLAEHVDDGESFFKLICEQDLEGIVAKRRDAAYGVDWFKIRNPAYTQYQGRRELFDRRR